jgi:hypothetical protein
MADGVKCIECHTTISQGHSLTAVKKACVQCHEAGYEGMTDEWQKTISGKMKELRLSLETFRGQKKMAWGSEKRNVEALLKEVRDLLKAIDADKSKGVHNFIYANKLISDAEEKVLLAKKTLSKPLE